MPHGDHRERLLRAPRRPAHGERRRDQARRSARSRASCTPTSPSEPDAERAVPRRRRGVRGALRPRAPSDLRPLREGGPRSVAASSRSFADFGSLSDVFAAFFGEDLLGGAGAGRPRPARGRRPGGRGDRARGGVHRGRGQRPARGRRSRASAATRRGAEPGTSAEPARPAPAPAPSAASRRTSSASSSSNEPAPSATAPARSWNSHAPTAAARAAIVRARSSRSTSRKGIHDGQQIRVRGEGHAGFRSAERGHAFVVVRVRPDPRFVRDGDDLHTALRLTMTEAALGTAATVSSLAGDVELDVPAGTEWSAKLIVCKGRKMSGWWVRRSWHWCATAASIASAAASRETMILETWADGSPTCSPTLSHSSAS